MLNERKTNEQKISNVIEFVKLASVLNDFHNLKQNVMKCQQR